MHTIEKSANRNYYNARCYANQMIVLLSYEGGEVLPNAV